MERRKVRIGVHDEWFLNQFHNGVIEFTFDFRVCRTEDKVLIDRLSEGYYVMFLRNHQNGQIKTLPAHRLIWMVVNGGPIPDGLVINHKDGVKVNNSPLNLELSTHSHNNAHAHALQLNSSRNELNSRALFSNSEVVELRKRFATTDISSAKLAAEYNVSRQQMWQLLKGKSYSTVFTPFDDMCRDK